MSSKILTEGYMFVWPDGSAVTVPEYVKSLTANRDNNFQTERLLDLKNINQL